MTDDIEREPTEREKAQARNARIGEATSAGARNTYAGARRVAGFQVPRSVSARRKIVLAMLLAFVIRILATVKADDAVAGKGLGFKSAIEGQNLIAWGVLVAMLSLASDIDATSDIAVAFAFLILVAALLSSGTDAIKNLDTLITGGKKLQKQVKNAGKAT